MKCNVFCTLDAGLVEWMDGYLSPWHSQALTFCFRFNRITCQPQNTWVVSLLRFRTVSDPRPSDIPFVRCSVCFSVYTSTSLVFCVRRISVNRINEKYVCGTVSPCCSSLVGKCWRINHCTVVRVVVYFVLSFCLLLCPKNEWHSVFSEIISDLLRLVLQLWRYFVHCSAFFLFAFPVRLFTERGKPVARSK